MFLAVDLNQLMHERLSIRVLDDACSCRLFARCENLLREIADSSRSGEDADQFPFVVGNRQFTKEDIDNVRTIYHLVKEKGFTLQGAKEMLKNDSGAVKDKMEMIDSLRRVRNFLLEVREKL